MARRYWRISSSSFEVEAIPPPPSASPPEIRGIASTSQDSEGIRQYLLAMVMPLSQYWPVLANTSHILAITSHILAITSHLLAITSNLLAIY